MISPPRVSIKKHESRDSQTIYHVEVIAISEGVARKRAINGMKARSLSPLAHAEVLGSEEVDTTSMFVNGVVQNKYTVRVAVTNS